MRVERLLKHQRLLEVSRDDLLIVASGKDERDPSIGQLPGELEVRAVPKIDVHHCRIHSSRFEDALCIADIADRPCDESAGIT